MSQAVQQHREANFEQMEGALESVWNNLCARAGLTRTDGRAYPLPKSRLLEAPTKNYNELIINLTNKSLHSPVNARARSHSLLPTPQPELSRVNTLPSPITTPPMTSSTPRWSISDKSSLLVGPSTAHTTPYTPSLSGHRLPASSIDLGAPAIPTCKATMYVEAIKKVETKLTFFKKQLTCESQRHDSHTVAYYTTSRLGITKLRKWKPYYMDWREQRRYSRTLSYVFPDVLF